jgi:hypothetical protein
MVSQKLMRTSQVLLYESGNSVLRCDHSSIGDHFGRIHSSAVLEQASDTGCKELIADSKRF